MPSIDAVGSTVRRRDGEILNVDVDVSRGTGGLLALDPLSGLGRPSAPARSRPTSYSRSLESGPYHIHEMQTRLGRRSNHLESSPVNSA